MFWVEFFLLQIGLMGYAQFIQKKTYIGYVDKSTFREACSKIK